MVKLKGLYVEIGDLVLKQKEERKILKKRKKRKEKPGERTIMTERAEATMLIFFFFLILYLYTSHSHLVDNHAHNDLKQVILQHEKLRYLTETCDQCKLETLCQSTSVVDVTSVSLTA